MTASKGNHRVGQYEAGKKQCVFIPHKQCEQGGTHGRLRMFGQVTLVLEAAVRDSYFI